MPYSRTFKGKFEDNRSVIVFKSSLRIRRKKVAIKLLAALNIQKTDDICLGNT